MNARTLPDHPHRPAPPVRDPRLGRDQASDALPETYLDRVVGAAGRTFDAPIALLSLVEGGRQRVRSSQGLRASERDAVASLCAEAGYSREPVALTNLLEDPRLAGSPLVTGSPGIRFFAGAPLETSDGVRVGALCVADIAPRARPALEQLSMLADLAALAGEQIELQRQLEKSLEADELRSRLAAIVDSTDDAILSKTLEGVVTSWNAAAERLYGYRADEVIGRHISLLVPPDRSGEVADFIERVRRAERVDHVETVRVRKDGTHTPVSLTISPVRNAGGQIIGASTVARDISDRKRVEAALAAARDAEKAANRVKSDFLATMSHEIRTPMNGVIGMIGLLLDTQLDPQQREYAETVRRSADALLEIINEILDFSKIEAGRMNLEAIEFDLRPVVEDVAELLAERAHAKGLELAVLIDLDVPSRVVGDPARLRQVLMNLIGNAVKFTEQGEVVVSAKLAEEAGGGALVRFEVADTGIGVPSESRAELFDPFAQAEASTTRTHGGTGLGLAISKQLAELMGGEIGVESTPGEGSCFWFTARLEQVSAPANLPTPRDDLSGLRVLIVDDNETNREILERQVGSWGMHARCVAGGEHALELLRAAGEPGELCDVALLDMQMPRMSGLELAAAIRRDRALEEIPLVLLTSSVVSIEDAREAGISAFLTKPVRQSRLHDALTMVLGSRSAECDVMVTRHTVSEARARDRPRLLLAEDNLVNQQVAVAMLGKLGYRTDVVPNGAEAVEALSRTPYAAVLMDCQMPEMDGYQATAEIRGREGADRHTPIIAMTAGAMAHDRERSLAAGMDDHISKPVDPNTLRSALERWINGEEGESRDAGTTDDATANGSTLDADRLSALRALQMDGEPDVLRELVDPFLDDAPKQVEALKAGVDAQDAHALKEVAHALKGSSANLGAPRLAALCAELEDIGRSGNLMPAGEALSRLESEVDRVQAAFRAELQKPVCS